ncbi:MAG: tetratricopeptide repeat protein, partial [Planctomycetota bacterium]|nr:tetratricopeptide repeat protein [Planctomycetota bacterium]
MPDAQDLLRHAVPRLKKDDDGARKLEKRLVRMARDAVADAGRLEALGVRRKREPAGDDLEAIRAALGDKGFVALFRGLKDELAASLKKGEAKERPASGRAAKASGRATKASGRAKKARASSSSSGRVRKSSGSGRMTISSHDNTGSGSGELAVPDELALPPDDALAFPDEPMSIRFDAEPAAGQATSAPAARDEDDADPGRAADRAVARYRSSGDPDELDQAKKLYTRAAKSAEHDLARGAARAGLAQVALLQGDTDKAVEHAEKALALFPAEPVAARVLLRAR